MLSVVACFGAGAFLGAYMLHLLPEVNELLCEAWLVPAGIDYPVPQMLVGIGFFMLLFIEHGIHTLNDCIDNKDTKTAQSATNDTAVADAGDISPADGGKMDVQSKSSGSPIGQEFVIIPISVNQECMPPEKLQNSLSPKSTISKDSAPSAKSNEADQVSEGGEEDMSAMKTVVLFVALSFDSVFAGLGLGLQKNEAGVWNMVLAILSHEIVFSFVLVLELLKHHSAKRAFWLGFTYATMAPLGIAAGTAIYVFVGGGDGFIILSGILHALCGGIFLYITFVGILSRELIGNGRTIKILAVVLGYLLLALVKLVPSEGDYIPDDLENDTEQTTAASLHLANILT